MTGMVVGAIVLALAVSAVIVRWAYRELAHGIKDI